VTITELAGVDDRSNRRALLTLGEVQAAVGSSMT